MSAEENKAIARRYVEEVQSGHDLDAMERYISQDIVDHTGPPGSVPGIERSKQFFAGLFRAFPDLRAEIHEQIADDDKVWTYKTMHGTHLGDFFGTAPTGKSISYDVIDIVRIRDGKITDHWAVSDQLGMRRQLGLVE
ncbi:MAG: ester cyclase [Chloroflexi bacterium]|nr:ester cyclase [Chloroflexota bacterium]MCZ6789284.1 ester cyclase [Chloroflexota bacterium]